MGQSEADKRFEKTLRALGYAILQMQRAAEQGDPQGCVLREVRFKLDADNRTSVLAILKGDADVGQRIAFVGGPDLEGAVHAVGKALGAGVLKWREDLPYTP